MLATNYSVRSKIGKYRGSLAPVSAENKLTQEAIQNRTPHLNTDSGIRASGVPLRVDTAAMLLRC